MYEFIEITKNMDNTFTARYTIDGFCTDYFGFGYTFKEAYKSLINNVESKNNA